jgi:HD-like signal output (HDOD) protein
MHDVSNLVIAERTPAHFPPRHATSLGRRLNHISHAEVGAYLLSMWGLPYPVVEAVAPNTIHAALPPAARTWSFLSSRSDLLANEREALARVAAPPELDMELLEQAGIAERLPE